MNKLKVKVKESDLSIIKFYKSKNLEFTRVYKKRNKKKLLLDKLKTKNDGYEIFNYDFKTREILVKNFNELIFRNIKLKKIQKKDIFKFYYYFELVQKITVGIMKNNLIQIDNIFFEIFNGLNEKEILIIVEFFNNKKHIYRKFIHLEDIWDF